MFFKRALARALEEKVEDVLDLFTVLSGNMSGPGPITGEGLREKTKAQQEQKYLLRKCTDKNFDILQIDVCGFRVDIIFLTK